VIEYRALLIEYRALLIPTEQLEEMMHKATRGHEMVIVFSGFILFVDRAVLRGSKEPYILSKEPYILSKKPYIRDGDSE